MRGGRHHRTHSRFHRRPRQRAARLDRRRAEDDGFFPRLALSLFGRPQDKLSHVLVSEPFESSGGFYYPTPVSRVLELSSGRLVDSANATVTLADLPFVSQRNGLPKALLTGHATYNEAVEAARLAIAPPELCLDLEARRILASGNAMRTNWRCSASLRGEP